MTRLCLVEGCSKPYHAHGYCARHAYHFKAHGDPLGGRRGASPGEPLRWIKDNASYAGDDCLTWPFEISRWGYGTVRHNGKKRIASRVMCEEAHGLPDDPDMDAAHSCGNGHLACMNAQHLRWATRLENVADAKAHGTWAEGQRKKSPGLTDDMVREIRALWPAMTQRAIAEKFNIGETRAHNIIHRKAWAWVE